MATTLNLSDYAFKKKEDLFNIANTIRTALGTDKDLTVGDMAQQIEAVYQKGKDEQHNEFWEDLQKSGERTDYAYAFAYYTENMFKPIYDIRPTGSAAHIFLRSSIKGDLVEKLNTYGVELGLSKATSLQLALHDAYFSRVGVIDVRNTTGTYALQNLFYNANRMQTIDKIIVDENCAAFNNSFHYCTVINVTFEGVIAKNGLNFSQTSNISHDSLMSAINCLKDYSTDTSGASHTVTLGTTNLAKLTDAEKAIATQKGWTLA